MATGNTVTEMTTSFALGRRQCSLTASGAAVQMSAEAERGAVEIVVTADRVDRDAPVRLVWRWPMDRAVLAWSPHSAHAPALPASWSAAFTVEAMHSAPIGCLIAADDTNDLLFAVSVDVSSVDVAAGVEEETGDFLVRLAVTALAETADETGRAHFALRLDARTEHFAACLRDAAWWWRRQLGDSVLGVPESARAPAYSTWYSMHQRIDAASVEQQVQESQRLGCEVVIVDDGWQTDDASRGYSWCGDWEPTASAFPDMAAHVARVRELGARYMLWYALPLLGRKSRAWDALHEHTLGWADGLQAAVLDPRSPRVRDHLTAVCLRAVRDWDVDGLKLDFIDAFASFPPPERSDIDCGSVGIGAERLLEGIIREVRRERPDALVEFRQNYVGPRMWRYANLLRAGDCPLDAIENRVRTIDLRLMAADRAVHGDMLMWRLDAPPEAAALQLISVLFSVPQISVPIDQLPTSHREALKFWLQIMREHAGVLQLGDLRPSGPGLRYPVVTARSAEVTIAAVYADAVAAIDQPPTARALLVNGSPRPEIAVRVEEERRADATVYDCRGRVVDERPLTIERGVSVLPVPIGGLGVLDQPAVHAGR